jgi:predicted metal-dependent HD superfamily phosphohydrolase
MKGGEAVAEHPLFPVWATDLAQVGRADALVRASFNEIVAAYQSPGRFYHTLAHVADVLKTVDDLSDHCRDRGAVRLAAWYHDAVYDSHANDNEERSAAMARPALSVLGVSGDRIEAVARLILTTKTHQTDGDPDAAVLLDADVAIFGSEPQQYERDAKAIRREYAWVPEEQYRAGRANILQRFLGRAAIFQTTPMQAREETARDNLRREIARLTAAV